MTPELQDRLFKKYKNIFGEELKTIECRDGWYHLIDALCESIQDHLNVENSASSNSSIPRLVPTCRKTINVAVAQIKTKFGGMRFYYDGGDEAVKGMVKVTEYMSTKICELCGNPGKTQKKNFWVYTTCDICYSTLRVKE